MSDLIFRFTSDPDSPVEWYLRDGGDDRVQRGSMTDLARQATGRRCILVADGSQILLTRAEVPSRQKSTILKAIPYALEDHFAEDVEELHFAIGERDADGGIPVAVTREALMTEWLAHCQEGGVTPSAVVPEPLLVPYTEGETVLLMDGDRALVRTGAASGYVADRDMLAVLLTSEPSESSEQLVGEVAAGEAATGEEPAGEEPAGEEPGAERGEGVDSQTHRKVLRIYGQVDSYVLPSSDSVEIHREALEVDPLVVLAHQFRPASVINLLQGPHSPRARVGRLLNPWRAAAAVALLIVATQFGVNLVERFRLQRESEALTQRIEQIYRRAFPNARKGGDPRMLMESHLKAMRESGAAGDTGLLDLLTQAGPLLVRVENVQITGLNYREGGLTLSLTAPSLQTVDQLRQSLVSNRPLEVEIQSASSRDGKVNSRLLIREATL